MALAPCPAGKVLFYTPIGLLAREEALTSTALIGLPGQLKDELESFPLDKIELILYFPQKRFSTSREGGLKKE